MAAYIERHGHNPVGLTGKVTAAGSSNKGLMVFLIVVLIIINVGWFVYMRKRK